MYGVRTGRCVFDSSRFAPRRWYKNSFQLDYSFVCPESQNLFSYFHFVSELRAIPFHSFTPVRLINGMDLRLQAENPFWKMCNCASRVDIDWPRTWKHWGTVRNEKADKKNVPAIKWKQMIDHYRRNEIHRSDL